MPRIIKPGITARLIGRWSPGVPANNPPTISGTPDTTVAEDVAYSFIPTGNDPDGDPITFSIVNKPSWATFSTVTGALTGTPTGVDIGTTSGIVITVSDGSLTDDLDSFDLEVTAALAGAPIITRKTHLVDTYAAVSTTLTVIYVSDRPCFWQEKEGFTDMTVAISTNGLEMTLEYAVPSDANGDSGYIGAEAWNYGDDSTEQVSVLWDRWHIAKTSGDILLFGDGTAETVLQAGIEQTASAGDTFICTDGLYQALTDTLMVGSYDEGNETNTATPNGVDSGVTTVNVIGADAVTVTGTEDIVNITKFTVIMSETPCGAIVDRLYFKDSSRLIGNYRSGPTDGFRTTHGIKIKGFGFRNVLNGPSMQRTDECAYECYSVVADTLSSDFDVNYSPDDPIFLDGGMLDMLSTRNCHAETMSSIGNTRFGTLAGRVSPSSVEACKHSGIRKAIVTNACSAGWADELTQGFTSYGARHFEYLNCLTIDSELFKDGIGEKEFDSTPMDPDYDFISTNSAADDVYLEGIGALNGIRGGMRIDLGNFSIDSTLKNSFLHGKNASLNVDTPMIRAEYLNVENLTVGKNHAVNASWGSVVNDDNDLLALEDILVLYPRWDETYTDKIIGDSIAIGQAGIDENLAFIPDTETPTANWLTNVTTSNSYAGANIKTVGCQYLTKIEEGSTVAALGVGVDGWFSTIGLTGELYLDSARTRDTDINWLSRAPYLEWRTERATYSSTVDAVEYVGNVGAFADNVLIVDYLNSQGTSPTFATNCPYIEDMTLHLDGSGDTVLTWRPLSVAYRSTVDEYDLYVDDILDTSAVSKTAITHTFTGLASGSHKFNIIVKDSTNGDSGPSRSRSITTA